MTIIGITADLETLEEFPYWRTMLDGVVEFGAAPLLLDRQQPGGIFRWLKRIDGLILSGGGDVAPQRYGATDARGVIDGASITRDQIEESLYLGALSKGMPVLAICRGLQLVNVVHGGTLALDVSDLGLARQTHQPGLEKLRESAHTASVMAETQLARILDDQPLEGFRVNSQHHQAADQLGDGLTVSGRASDGSVEALELVNDGVTRMVAVQWHPEVDWPTNPHSYRLLERFTASASAYGEDPGTVRGWQ